MGYVKLGPSFATLGREPLYLPASDADYFEAWRQELVRVGMAGPDDVFTVTDQFSKDGEIRQVIWRIGRRGFRGRLIIAHGLRPPAFLFTPEE